MLMSPEFNDCQQILETVISNPASLKDVGLRSTYLNAALTTHEVLLSDAGVPQEDIQSTLDRVRTSPLTRQEIMNYCQRMVLLGSAREIQLKANEELLLGSLDIF